MRHKKRPDICALGSQTGSDKFGSSAFHQLSQARIRDGMKNPSTQLKSAWDENIKRFGAALFASGTAVKLLQMPVSIRGGWYPEANRKVGTIAISIA